MAKAGIEDRVRGLALRFADDVVRAVRQGLAQEVASQMTLLLRSATSGTSPLTLGSGPMDRRIGKPPVPVRCPAPGCGRAGIRAKRNFCAEHAGSISDAEKRRLRQAQQARVSAKRKR